MIYDGISAIGGYRGLFRGLDVLIDWLGEHDPAQLPLGVTEICGTRVFANVMEARTKLEVEARFETHRRYLDVQIDLEGAERFKTTTSPLVPVGAFDEAADKGYCLAASDGADFLEGCLANGRFVIFMVGEPHMPNLVCLGEEPGPIKKICFKILEDAFWGEID